MGGLRRRTAIAVLVGSLLPLLLAGIAAAVKIESDLVSDIIADHRLLIRQIELNVRAEMSWHRRQLDTLASEMKVQSLDPETARGALELFLDLHPLFHRVTLHRADGTLLATAQHGTGGTAGVVTPAAVTRALAALRLAPRELLLLPAADHADLNLAAAVPSLKGDGQAIGALVATMRRHGPEFQDLVEDMKFVGHTYVYVTDSVGEVVARAGELHPRSVRWMNVHGSEGGEVTAGVSTVLGRRDVVAAAPILDFGLAVIVGRPYEEVSRALREILGAVAFYVIFGVLVAVILGVALSQALARPILDLTDGIQRVARGELAHRLPTTGPDELVDAARAFNDLAGQLQKGRLLEELWAERRKADEGRS